MNLYTFQITVPANTAAPINLAVAAIAASAVLSVNSEFSATWLPAAKVRFQMHQGGSGAGYIGGAGVTFQGVNAAYELLAAATAGTSGEAASIDTGKDNNTIQLSELYAHGATQGDKIDVSYWQA